jgi:hypothetical protein
MVVAVLMLAACAQGGSDVSSNSAGAGSGSVDLYGTMDTGVSATHR